MNPLNTWLKDTKSGGGMSIAAINKQLDIQKKELKQRCELKWKLWQQKIKDWSKQKKDDDDLYQERFDL